MKWQNSFSTGIKKIDEEHKILVQLLNKLESSIASEDEERVIALVLRDLVDYVKFHFKSEEEVMKKINFPDLHRHKKLHKNLVHEVATILVDLKNGRDWSGQELIAFLQHWLMEHIIGEDLKIGQYLGVI